VKETKCFYEGDDYCEYHMKWKIKPLLKTLAEVFVPWRALRLSIEEMEQDKEMLRQKFDEVHKLYIQLQESNLELEQKNIKLNENQELLRQKIEEVNNLNIQLQEKNVQLIEKINKLECLQDTGTNILSVRYREELFQVTLRALKNNAHLNRAGIFLVDEKTRTLRFGHAVGLDEPGLKQMKDYMLPFSKLDNLIARVYNSGQAVVINDVDESNLNKNNPMLQLLKPKTIIVAPLTSRGTVTGVLLADRTPGTVFFQKVTKILSSVLPIRSPLPWTTPI